LSLNHKNGVIFCIVIIPLLVSADIARIWESLDPFGPTVARLT
jgi:hypothetical protein